MNDQLEQQIAELEKLPPEELQPHYGNLMALIARRRLMRPDEPLPETARALNLSTLELVGMMDSSSFEVTTELQQIGFVLYVAGQIDGPVAGESTAAKFERAVRLARDFPRMSRWPHDWDN